MAHAKKHSPDDEMVIRAISMLTMNLCDKWYEFGVETENLVMEKGAQMSINEHVVRLQEFVKQLHSETEHLVQEWIVKPSAKLNS